MTDRPNLAAPAMPASPRTGDILTATPAAHEMWKHLVDIGAGSDTATLVRLALQEARAEAAQQAAPLDVERLTANPTLLRIEAIFRDAHSYDAAYRLLVGHEPLNPAPAQARPADAALAHEHDFVDPTNEIVNSNGYLVCRICGRLQQPTPAEGA